MEHIIILDIVPRLFAILGLLAAWRHHRNKIISGGLLPIDIFNPSGIRLYFYVTPDDDDVCSSCREAHGKAFLARTVTRKGFSPLSTPCKSPEKCSSVLIGFYGAWWEAGDVVTRLRSVKKMDSLRLSPEELRKLINGQWKLSASADMDRVSVHMLSALLNEKTGPNQAVVSYGVVVDQAKGLHHLALLAPAYIRLAGLLARRGDLRKAIQIIEHFEKWCAHQEPGPFYPTGKQCRAMSVMKPYLLSMLYSSHESPAKPASLAPTQ